MGELSQTFMDNSTLSSTMTSPSQRKRFSENNVADHRLRLPPCTTEIFHGDYLSWPSFRDMFTAVLLGTAIVQIDVNGVIFAARALIDSGSQATFISEKLQRRLNLPIKKVNARISGLNDALAGSTEKQCTFWLKSPHSDSFEVQVSSLVLPRLTGKLPSYTLDIPDIYSLGIAPLADPKFAKSDQVDILLGGDIYPQILLGGVQRNVLGSLLAQETIFGWVLTGPIASPNSGSFTTCVSFCTAVEMDKLLEKFWKLEEPPKISEYSPEEVYCEEVYQKTKKRLSDGRFVVSLPFKPQYEDGKGLGLSRTRACRQFLRNEASLSKKPEFKSVYDSVLEEYETLGHMTEVVQDEEDFSCFYLPHHAVIKPESSSTKVRVVFNASSKSTTGLSLNDTLYPGPILQNDLMLLIIRWRFYRYVFNGDVEKMYRQIWLNEDHTRFQRLVFRKDPKASLKSFELKTVTFGVNCAPVLAIRTFLQLASDVEKDLPLAAKILRRMMYVDDALAGAHELALAIEARDQLVCALSSAGFSMRKWTSNEEKILQGLPPDHLLSEKFLEIEDESNAKTLGIRWNAKNDFFYFSVKPIQMKSNFTKREVLSIIASLFDPADYDDVLGEFSSYAKALRLMSYVFRFVDRLKGQKSFSNKLIGSEELQRTKERLVIIAQKVYYIDEYHCLLNGKELSSKSNLLSLHPFIDSKGLMRVGGRLSNATELALSERHPLILPYNCKMSRLLINFIHQVTLHGNDISSLDVLTPGHFLVGGPILSPPEPEIYEAPESIINRWQRVKALNQRLCIRWKNEYLKELTKRNKWKNPDENVKVNDMVVIKEDNIPPNEWRLGRVTSVLPGADQLVRVAEVKTERGLIVRPVVKLVVLPSN
ncbi:uncharacterized protein [Musca autumnalis]|uniref:uncharacterized protein n=1 Tax=Musca autumnalis TaxID=221902 RepID=UPI003CF195E4